MGHGRKPNIAILVLAAFVWVQPACLGAVHIKHPAGKQHACFLASPHHAHMAGHTRGSVTAKGRPEPAPQRTLVRFPLLSVLGDTFKNPWCGQTFTLIEDIEHGQDRRRKGSAEPLGPRFYENAPASRPHQLLGPLENFESTLEFKSGLFERHGQDTIFWTSIVPKDKTKIENVLVFHHGLNDHCGWAAQHAQITHAAMFNSATFCFDMPGWGRSDGLFMHIPDADWWKWIGHAESFITEVVLPQRCEWELLSGRRLKLFGHGESMGGAIGLSVALKSPDLYDGLVLSAPAVNGAKEVMPHPIILWLLMTFIVPLVPTLPQAPFEDVTDKCHEDSALAVQARENPFSPRGKKLRFSTGGALVTGVTYFSEHMEDVKIPFLVMHSKKDTVTSPESSQLLYERASSVDKTLRLWEEGCHADALTGGPLHKELMKKAYLLCGSWIRERQ